MSQKFKMLRPRLTIARCIVAKRILQAAMLACSIGQGFCGAVMAWANSRPVRETFAISFHGQQAKNKLLTSRSVRRVSPGIN